MTVMTGALYPQRPGALSRGAYSFRNGGWADLATALGMGILSADGQNVTLPQGIAAGLQNFQQTSRDRQQEQRQSMLDELMFADIEDKRASREAEKARAANLAATIEGLGRPPTKESYKNFWQQDRTREKPGGPLTPDQARALLGLSPDAQEKVLTEQLFPKNEPYTLGPGQVRYQGSRVLAEGLDPVALERDKFNATLPGRLQVAGAGRSVTSVNVDPGVQIGAIPQGYEVFKNPETGGYQARPIAGGPADIELQKEGRAAESKVMGKAQSVETTVGALDELEGLVKSGGVTGLSSLIDIPGSKVARAKELVATVTANIGFDRLQLMKDSSATGGALGQIAIQELEQLQKSAGSLALRQDDKDVLKSIQNIKKRYDGIMAGVEKERERLGIKSGTASENPTSVPAISGDVTQMSDDEIINELRAMGND